MCLISNYSQYQYIRIIFYHFADLLLEKIYFSTRIAASELNHKLTTFAEDISLCSVSGNPLSHNQISVVFVFHILCLILGHSHSYICISKCLKSFYVAELQLNSRSDGPDKQLSYTLNTFSEYTDSTSANLKIQPSNSRSPCCVLVDFMKVVDAMDPFDVFSCANFIQPQVRRLFVR